MIKNRKTLFIGILMLSFGIVGLMNTNVTPVKAQNPTIKIGALGPLAITPGADMEKGVKLAVEEINAAGGVDVDGVAHDFELVIETTSGENGLPDPTVGVTNLVKLKTSENVVAVIGGFRTEVVVGIQQNLGETPFLGVGSTAPIITPYFWRVGPTNGSQLALSIMELYMIHLSAQGVNKITIAREDAAWTGVIGPALKAVLGVNKLHNFTFTDDIVVATSASQDAVNSAMNAANNEDYSDAILTLFSAPVGKQVTQAWASLNMTQFLAGINVEAQKSDYFETTNGAAYGEIVLMTSKPDENTTTKSGPFKQAYYDEYLELPTYTSFASYDSVYVLKDAIERAKAADSASIQTALVDTDYVGASFKIAFTNKVIPNYFNSSLNVTAHDLFTPDHIGTSGGDYANPVFAQWQQNGVFRTVYASPTDKGEMEWPINHGNYTFTEPEAPAFGFEAPAVVVGFFFLAALVQVRKRR